MTNAFASSLAEEAGRSPKRSVAGAAHDMSSTLLAVLALLVAMVSFQTGASLAKQLFPLVGPVGTTTLRLLFGALILCAIWRQWRQKLARAELRTIAIYGVAMGGMNLCFYIALQTIPLGMRV